MSERVVVTVILAAICLTAGMLAGMFAGYDLGSNAVTETRDSRDYRQMQLDLADMESRIETLERIGVEVEISDRSGTWFVLNGKVQ